MKKYIGMCLLFFYIACAPAVKTYPRHDLYLGSRQAVNPIVKSNEPDTFDNGIGLNPYLQGYNDGMMTAKNESFGVCLIGGCLTGAAGVVAGFYAPQIMGGDQYYSGDLVIPLLSLAGGITASFGSVYLANRIAKFQVPDPMDDDTLYQKGFIDGYRKSYQSQRLGESMKGTALGVGTACAGYVAVALFFIVLIGSMFGW